MTKTQPNPQELKQEKKLRNEEKVMYLMIGFIVGAFVMTLFFHNAVWSCDCITSPDRCVLIGFSKPITTTTTTTTLKTKYPCAEGRECIDVCNSTLLVMREGECRTGCTIHKGKLVGYYELLLALENC